MTDHAFPDSLRDKKGAMGVGHHHLIEILWRDIFRGGRFADPGIVNQDIDGSEFGFRDLDGLMDGVDIGNIHTYRQSPPVERRNFPRQRFQFFRAPCGQRYLDPGPRKCQGKLPAQAGGRAGDKCVLAFKIMG